MSGARRSAVAAEAARRNREQRTQIGGEVRASRERRNWTQAELAGRAGISRHIVGRIERASTRLDVDALQRIGIALDRKLEIQFRRDTLEQPVDAGHLAMQELLLRLGRACGYTGTFELPTRPAEPWRSADVGLAAPARRILILGECWTTFGDVGAAARSSTRKLTDLEVLAIARWGTEARVGLVWVVRATARNRALVARYPEIFAGRFPGSSRGWIAALTTGAAPPSEPGLVWCDVAATRLLEWRRHMTSPPPAWRGRGDGR
jgi:transcriptional regulator with XRE-family HTH domain